VSGQFLVTAGTCSPCREQWLLWSSELGLVFVTVSGTTPVIKVLVNFFHMAPGFLQKTEPVCLYALPYLHGALCWDQQCPELQCARPVLPLQ